MRVNGRCVVATASRSGKSPCVRYILTGDRMTHRSAAGADILRLGARLSAQMRATRGSRLVAVARTPAGLFSAPVSIALPRP
jgi:hypothetical protein